MGCGGGSSGEINSPENGTEKITSDDNKPDIPNNPISSDPAPTPEQQNDKQNTTEPEQTPVETPTTIVSTGPEAIVTGAVGAGSVVTALGYYIASRKKLN